MYSKSCPLPLSHLGRNVVLNNAKPCEQKSELRLSVVVCIDVTLKETRNCKRLRKNLEEKSQGCGICAQESLSGFSSQPSHAVVVSCKKFDSFKNQKTFLNSHLGAFQLASQSLLLSWAT